MAFHVTSSRNYAVQYFDFRIPSNCNSLSEALHKGKSLYAWFGLTKHASFLANSDISRGLRNPLCGPKSFAVQWVRVRWPPAVCLSRYRLIPAGCTTLLESRTHGQEAWQGTGAWTRAAERPLFPTTWRAGPPHDLGWSHNQGLRSPRRQLTFADAWGRRGRKERVAITQWSLNVKGNWLCLKDS